MGLGAGFDLPQKYWNDILRPTLPPGRTPDSICVINTLLQVMFLWFVAQWTKIILVIIEGSYRFLFARQGSETFLWETCKVPNSQHFKGILSFWHPVLDFDFSARVRNAKRTLLLALHLHSIPIQIKFTLKLKIRSDNGWGWPVKLCGQGSLWFQCPWWKCVTLLSLSFKGFKNR